MTKSNHIFNTKRTPVLLLALFIVSAFFLLVGSAQAQYAQGSYHSGEATETTTVHSAKAVIVTTDSLQVRATAGLTGTALGTVLKNASGRTIDGPKTVDGLTWWKVDFSTGTDGWVAGTYLRLITLYTERDYGRDDRDSSVTTTSSAGTGASQSTTTSNTVSTTRWFKFTSISATTNPTILGSVSPKTSTRIKILDSKGTVVHSNDWVPTELQSPLAAAITKYTGFWAHYVKTTLKSGSYTAVVEDITTSSAKELARKSFTVSATTSTGPTNTTTSNTATSKHTPMSVLVIDDRVKVRAATGLTGTMIGMVNEQASGRTVDGPKKADGYTWWKVDFTTGTDGWVAANFLRISSNRPTADDFRRDDIATTTQPRSTPAISVVPVTSTPTATTTNKATYATGEGMYWVRPTEAGAICKHYGYNDGFKVVTTRKAMCVGSRRVSPKFVWLLGTTIINEDRPSYLPKDGILSQVQCLGTKSTATNPTTTTTTPTPTQTTTPTYAQAYYQSTYSITPTSTYSQAYYQSTYSAPTSTTPTTVDAGIDVSFISSKIEKVYTANGEGEGDHILATFTFEVTAIDGNIYSDRSVTRDDATPGGSPGNGFMWRLTDSSTIGTSYTTTVVTAAPSKSGATDTSAYFMVPEGVTREIKVEVRMQVQKSASVGIQLTAINWDTDGPTDSTPDKFHTTGLTSFKTNQISATYIPYRDYVPPTSTTPTYSQAYYQSTYSTPTPTYAQGSYYSQASYYSQGTYGTQTYSQAGYCLPGSACDIRGASTMNTTALLQEILQRIKVLLDSK